MRGGGGGEGVPGEFVTRQLDDAQSDDAQDVGPVGRHLTGEEEDRKK